MTPEQIIVVIMCYLGVIAGAALPYYRKRQDIENWDRKYTYVVIGACIMSAVTLDGVILQYAESVTAWNGLLMPLFTAFMTGFGFVAGTSEFMKIFVNVKARWIPVDEVK